MVEPTSERKEEGRITAEQDPSLDLLAEKNLRRMGCAALRKKQIPIAIQVGRSSIRVLRRILDFDRLAGQFLPRLLLVVGEQGHDLGHVLLLRGGPLVPSVPALLLAGVLVERSRERGPRRCDDVTDPRLLVVGQFQLLVDGGISEGLESMRLQADLIKPP